MLVAKSTIFFHNHQYLPGDRLPEDAEEKNTWIECGSAYETEAVKERPKAKRASAKAGRTGIARGNLESDENLIGRVPDNPARKRK